MTVLHGDTSAIGSIITGFLFAISISIALVSGCDAL